ncbi:MULTISPECIES: hypothetical protein [unclassified Streptomyces]|uniref:hypothetical protein n=1 Tax=unclassified Streptomyces TaxID=2593676 RepID=UPI003821389F
MTNIHPEAAFDSLTICSELQQVTKGATENEIHLFAYLSCLLFVYKGSPPSEWRYQFIATPSVAPFSVDISAAITELCRIGYLEEGTQGIQITDLGRDELESFSGLSILARRTPYLEGACGSTLVLPLPSVTESISAEPQLHKALELSSTRPLLDEIGREAILDHFEALSRAVPEASDLMVPAVVWLEYLASTIAPAAER